MLKSKKGKIMIGILATFIIILGIGSFLSYSKFSVINPFSTTHGLLQIMFTEKEYLELQSYPKVILAKPTLSLNDYMKSQGFKEDEENQMGALHMYTNETSVQYVMYSVNRYFAKWRWQE